MVLNVAETVLFIIPAIIAYRHDRKAFKADLGDLVGAELGKGKPDVTLKDIKSSENPLVQTQVNRFRSLYLIRFGMPFTFLWGLGAGVTASVFQVVAERSAYFEKNSFERLQKISQEITNNEWGDWSRDGLVEQFIQVAQVNRAEHKAPPITVHEIQNYLPLFNKIARKAIDKQWGFQEILYTLGQIIKEPALPQKAEKAFDDLDRLGLSGIAKEARFGPEQPRPAAAPVASMPVASAQPPAKEALDAEINNEQEPGAHAARIASETRGKTRGAVANALSHAEKAKLGNDNGQSVASVA